MKRDEKRLAHTRIKDIKQTYGSIYMLLNKNEGYIAYSQDQQNQGHHIKKDDRGSHQYGSGKSQFMQTYHYK